MQFRGAEIRVRRVVFVQLPPARIAKQYTTASIRLQSVLVRINHNRIRFPNTRETTRRVFAQIRRQRKIPSVRSIRMYAKSKLLLQLQDFAYMRMLRTEGILRWGRIWAK